MSFFSRDCSYLLLVDWVPLVSAQHSQALIDHRLGIRLKHPCQNSADTKMNYDCNTKIVELSITTSLLVVKGDLSLRR